MNGHDSLARGVTPSPPGTLHVRSVSGGLRVAPRPGMTICFGRQRPAVDLCVGEDDQWVSRRHGELTYRQHHWWLRNTGQQLIRLPKGHLMHLSTEPVPLCPGYTPLFVRGSARREHLVELYVVDHDEARSGPRHSAETVPPKRWPLDDDERLVLVVLGQQYLLFQEDPRPLAYRQAVEQLRCLRGDEHWTQSKVAHRVEAVRRRLSRSGDFPYEVMRDTEAGGPCDSNLMHNLFRGLVESTTLVPPDLGLVDEEPAAP